MHITEKDVGRKVRLRDGKNGTIRKWDKFDLDGMPVRTEFGWHYKNGGFLENESCEKDIVAFTDEPKRRGRPRKQVQEGYALQEPTPEHDPRLPHPDALRFLGSNETYDEIAIRLIREGYEAAGVYLLTGKKEK
jgi:hypothetical protein